MGRNKTTLKEKAAEALAFLDWWSLGICDSWREIVENICYFAGIKFPVEEDNPDLMKTSKEAYMVLVEKDPDLIKQNVIYYLDVNYSMINAIAFSAGAEKCVKKVHNLEEYILSKKDIFDEECVQKVQELDKKFASIDILLVKTGYYIGSELWKYLSPAHYFQSNTSFVVGNVILDDDTEKVYGQYVCHMLFKNLDKGYAVFFNRRGSRIYATVREYSRKNNVTTYGSSVLTMAVAKSKHSLISLSEKMTYLPTEF